VNRTSLRHPGIKENPGTQGNGIRLLLTGEMPMSAKLLLPLLLVTLLAAAGCAQRSAIESPLPMLEPSGEPSAVPLPLPAYPYDPGFWV
jgi:hypothetical protein